ncbi:MAG: transcription elongation factor GreA [Chloroflexi bacterium]|nr:transcription elongation factor GreA [Chloroflexota bacterium]
MYGKPVFLTLEGRSKLEAELNHLRDIKRAEIAEVIRLAKEFSDTIDNAEFEEAKNEQAFIEGRILTLEQLLANASIIESDHNHETVRLGSRVSVLNSDGEREEFTIVGSAEVNPREGKISNESPVGRALLGRKVGENIDVAAPAGVLSFHVVAID